MTKKKRDPAALLPLTSGMFHVLVALADGEKHGYAILKEVNRRSEGGMLLSAGTLYGVIQRLVAEGLIAESGDRPDPALDDERRRYYRLTPFGRDVAVAEAERMSGMLAIVRAKKLLPSPKAV